MLLVGLSYFAQGVSALETWGTGPHELIPPQLRCALWIVSGGIAVITAWRPVHDTNPLGWLALYVPPALWSLSYLMSWIAYLLPGRELPFEYLGGLTYAFVWGLVVAVILVCADWPEPPSPHPLAATDE